MHLPSPASAKPDMLEAVSSLLTWRMLLGTCVSNCTTGTWILPRGAGINISTRGPAASPGVLCTKGTRRTWKFPDLRDGGDTTNKLAFAWARISMRFQAQNAGNSAVLLFCP